MAAQDEVRLLLPMLGLATPAIDTASPLLMPLLRETSRWACMLARLQGTGTMGPMDASHGLKA